MDGEKGVQSEREFLKKQKAQLPTVEKIGEVVNGTGQIIYKGN